MKNFTECEFVSGQRLRSISGPAPIELYLKVGDNEKLAFHVKSLTVMMETGQMTGAPWVVAEHLNGEVSKHNCAMLESVEIDSEWLKDNQA